MRFASVAAKGWLHNVIKRGLSNHSQENAPSLKGKLRSLYKLIHPDLFGTHPEAKAANETSFKLLQEYLEEAKHPSHPARSLGLPYKFKFYLRSEQEEEEEDKFKIVSLTLPPPTSSGRPGDNAFSPSAIKGLELLLSSCGLSSDFTSPHNTNTSNSLREFIPQAAQIVHSSIQGSGPRHTVSAIRTALKFRRGVNVSFGGESGLSLPAHVQCTKLSLLVGILDHKLPDLDLHGLKIIIGSNSNSIDDQGDIWLGIDTPPPPPPTATINNEEHKDEMEEERWTSFLEKDIDLQICRQRKSLLTALHQQEMLTAAGLGIAFIGTHPHLALTNEYRSFLEAAAALCSNNTNDSNSGLLLQGLSKVVVVVVSSIPPPPPPTITTNSNSTTTNSRIDETTGALHVPVSLQGQPFIDILKTLGPRSSYIIRSKERLEAELSVLKKQVERRLRLRKLLRHDHHYSGSGNNGSGYVSPEQYKACCERLIGCGDQLQHMMEGMSIRIGRVNRVSADGSVISIAWNWTL